MRIYRYWTKCSRDILLPDKEKSFVQPTSVYGYSNASEEAARQCGEQLLDGLQKFLSEDAVPWSYDERPIREEILRELSPENIVTRNRYGAEVLNSTQLAFIDIDGSLPCSGGLFHWLAGLFGRKGSTTDLDRVAALAGAGPFVRGCQIRVYRTKAGYRLLLPDCGIAGKDSGPLMKQFHADPLYASLCRLQNCYRARLTPKPFRLRIHGRKFKFPERTEDEAAEEARWLEEYNAKMESYAVCSYLGTVNGPEGDSDNAAVRFHDDRTKAMSSLRLA